MNLKIWNASVMLALSLTMLGPLPVARADDTPPPQTVVIPGTLQSELGCSGDWFNKIDWTYQTNNWGVGLPVEGRDKWPSMSPLLSDPALKPSPADIQFAAAHFREMLQIRKSSPLFRLQTAEQVQRALTFFNTGPDQTPGLIVMRLSDVDGLGENYEDIVVLFNARPDAVSFADESFKGVAFELHSVQQNSVDAVLKTAAFDAANGAFKVPARTAAVFVLPQAAPKATAAPTVTSAAALTPAPTSTPGPTVVLPTVGGSDTPPARPAPSPALLGGLAVAILAVLGGIWAWRRRKK